MASRTQPLTSSEDLIPPLSVVDHLYVYYATCLYVASKAAALSSPTTLQSFTLQVKQ